MSGSAQSEDVCTATEPPAPAQAPAPAGPMARSVPDADSFVFDDVQMTAESVAPGTAPDRVRVTFDPRGIELDGGTPGPAPMVSWTDVRGVWFGLPMSPPTGGLVTPIDVVWVGGSARLLLHGDRMRSVRITALESRLFSWSPPPPTGPPPMPGRFGPSAPPAPPAPYGPDVPPRYPPGVRGARAHRSARSRRLAVLAVGVALIVAGLGLAVGLSSHHTGGTAAGHPSAPPLTADQRLAAQIMLTSRDLPVGWRVDRHASSSNSSQQLRDGETAITHTFASCMGISNAQASAVFGGQAPDQTAQTSSPIFVAPPSANHPGFALELQTGASIVRTHHDEQADLGPFSSANYPSCAADATASELQLGVNAASGAHGKPGPATGVLVALPAPAGEQLTALSVTFTVTDQSVQIPVQVESVLVGSDRIEAELQAFAIGGAIPGDVLHSSMTAFEQRVATKGTGVQI
jgi:hypothetical protein